MIIHEEQNFDAAAIDQYEEAGCEPLVFWVGTVLDIDYGVTACEFVHEGKLAVVLEIDLHYGDVLEQFLVEKIVEDIWPTVLERLETVPRFVCSDLRAVSSPTVWYEMPKFL